MIDAVNPVYNAAEAFLAIYASLPRAYIALITTSLTLFAVGILSRLIWGLRS